MNSARNNRVCCKYQHSSDSHTEKVPVAVQFWAGSVFETSFDVCPAWESMPLDVAARDIISDALKAECVDEQFKELGHVVLLNSGSNGRIQLKK